MIQATAPAANGDETLRDYARLLWQGRVLLIVSLLIFLLLGVIVVSFTRPTYRSITRLLLETRTPPGQTVDSTDPLSAAFPVLPVRDLATQTEMIRSDPMLSEAYRTARVPHGSVRLDIHPLPGTDIVEMQFDSNSANNAEKMATALPAACRNDVERTRQTYNQAALKMASQRLYVENKLLDQAEKSLLLFRDHAHIADLKTEREQSVMAAAAARDRYERSLEALSGSKARLDSLLNLRASLPPFLTRTTYTSNLEIPAARIEIGTLRTQRAKLLTLYKPSHIQIIQTDAQIAELEKHLDRMPLLTAATIRVPDPTRADIEDKISLARVSAAGAEAELSAANTSAQFQQSMLDRYTGLESRQQAFQRELDRHLTAASLLTRKVETFQERSQTAFEPFTILQGASRAQKVAPSVPIYMVSAALIGLLTGFSLILLREMLAPAQKERASEIAAQADTGTGETAKPETDFERRVQAEVERVLARREAIAAVDIEPLAVVRMKESAGSKTPAPEPAIL